VKISAIICTRDRPDLIGQAVESVAACDYPDFDLHILDQSTNDLTEKVVRAISERVASKVKVVYHHLDKAGLSRAYNAGVRVTDGEVIACTDDDVIVPSDWLTRIARAFQDDPEVGLLYGQVLVPESLKHTLNDGVVVPALHIPRRQRLAKGQGFKVFGMGANMAMRRTAFQRLGGFDEALGGGGPLRSSQDFDFAFRMYRFGQAILLAPDVMVDHYGSRTRDQWPGTLKAYGFGDGAFYSKHIRCGDPLAVWLFANVLFRIVGKQVKHLLKQRSLTRDEYAANLIPGMRAAAKFDLDRHHRLYRESRDAKMTMSEANAVTGAKRVPEQGRGDRPSN
jgi:GT2 family glycosyltransferase